MSPNEANEQHWKLLVLLIREIATEKGISISEIAEKCNMKQPSVSRIFSLKYSPTMENFIKICNAVKVNFFFEDKESKTDLSEMFNRAMDALGRNPENLPQN